MKLLTLSGRKPLSYRNQSIDLWSKSMDWFLYDNDLCHERVKCCVNSWRICYRCGMNGKKPVCIIGKFLLVKIELISAQLGALTPGVQLMFLKTFMTQLSFIYHLHFLKIIVHHLRQSFPAYLSFYLSEIWWYYDNGTICS